jgi:hypothetical protein
LYKQQSDHILQQVTKGDMMNVKKIVLKSVLLVAGLLVAARAGRELVSELKDRK